MKILAIDPSSNKHADSTTGIVLIDNAHLVKYWVVEYGVKGFKKWFNENQFLVVDEVVVEKYIDRDSNHSKDNTVLETINFIEKCYPNCKLLNNSGYATDVPDALLKALGMWKFDKSHHQDVRSAARLALFYAIRLDIEEVIQDIGRVVSLAFDNTKKVARRSS